MEGFWVKEETEVHQPPIPLSERNGWNSHVYPHWADGRFWKVSNNSHAQSLSLTQKIITLKKTQEEHRKFLANYITVVKDIHHLFWMLYNTSQNT